MRNVILKDLDKYGDIINLYRPVENEIWSRIEDFETVWSEKDPQVVFTEFVFCLLTPQSKAFSCWNAVEKIFGNDLVMKANAKQLAKELDGVRFCNNKAGYLIAARKMFVKKGRLIIVDVLDNFENAFDRREWLVANVKGYGYKEASHFLRNVGLGLDLAILDRHILKNLVNYGVIEEIPKTLSKKKYLEIEFKMKEFSTHIGIPISHLDLLLWYKQTGKIFK